jgi:hypothetical protein
MHLRTLIRIPLATGLIACLIGILAVQGTMQNFVLCQGADGHVAIEISPGSEGTCEPQSVRPTKPLASRDFLTNGFVLISHCGPCRDFALVGADSFYAPPFFAQSQNTLTSFTDLPAVLVLPSKPSLQPDKHFILHKQPAVLSAPLHLRSTFLLI